jgi:hypothetical protein
LVWPPEENTDTLNQFYLESSVENPYGLKFFDRPTDYNQPDEEDEDEYGENSCPTGCCDQDCECDDCIRCSYNGLVEPDSFADETPAAA